MEIPDRLAYPDHLMFVHAPLDQEKTSIRLVRVLPKLSDTLLIRCEVVHAVIPTSPRYDIDDLGCEEQEYELASLSSASEDDIEFPPYVCLSYTWGDPIDERAIEINGKIFKIRENLWTFLHMARKKFNDIHLWIDALCKSSLLLERLGTSMTELTLLHRSRHRPDKYHGEKSSGPTDGRYLYTSRHCIDLARS
jgi:hypothetical protein